MERKCSACWELVYGRAPITSATSIAFFVDGYVRFIDFTEKLNGTNNLSELDISVGSSDTESSFTITTTIDNTDFE